MQPRTELPPITKHVIVLLDIDRTLVIFREYTHSEMISYTGGYHTWVAGLRNFKEAASARGIKVHYGLATLKKRKHSTNSKLTADSIYGQIMADLEWELHTRCSYSLHLKEFIDPKLIFFLGEELEELSKHVTPEHLAALQKNKAPAGYPATVTASKITYISEEFFQCKALKALEIARQIVEKEVDMPIPKAQVYLIDDSPGICRGAVALGYSCICVHNLAENPLDKQQEVINKIFSGELLIEQLTKAGSPRDSQQNLKAANAAILSILQPPDQVSEILKFLTVDLPGQPANPNVFFKSGPENINQHPDDEKNTPASSSSLNYSCSSTEG